MNKSYPKLTKLVSPIDKINFYCKKYRIILYILLLLPISLCAYSLWGIMAAVLLDVIISIIYWFFQIYDYGTRLSAASLFMSALVTAVPIYDFCEGNLNTIIYVYKVNDILALICIFLSVFSAFNLVFSLINCFLGNNVIDFSSWVRLVLSASALLITVEIYLPLDTFVGNVDDFRFAVQSFIFILGIRFLLFLLIVFYLGLILKPKVSYILSTLALGLTLAVFVQYTFMNNNLGLLIGMEEDWDKLTAFGIINIVIWVILIVLPFVIGIILKKYKEKITAYASAFAAAVQLLSVVLILVFSQENIYEYKNSIMPDGRVQYDVAAVKNIVTFVFDATDNIYFKQLLEEEPEVFNGLEDFTLYNNTCSEYSYTFASLNQMLTGTTEDLGKDSDQWVKNAWQSDKVQSFYQRLHLAGYTVNGFVDDNTDWSLMYDCYDNTDYNMKPSDINYIGLAKDLERLSFYRYAPFFLKKTADISHVSCNDNVFYENQFKYYDNEYAESLKLKKRSDWKNCFLVQHLFGTHPPCDDVIAETKNCLNIVKEYIGQLKEIGLYEDSVIIVTADHGRYAYKNTDNWSSTPIFMIKEAKNSFDKMKISSAPIYHTDFLSTYLINAGLYTAADKEIYGASIYDFDESSQRERTWHCEMPAEEGDDYLLGFTYVGDSEELSRIIKESGKLE